MAAKQLVCGVPVWYMLTMTELAVGQLILSRTADTTRPWHPVSYTI